MISTDEITEIFYLIDEFYKEFEKVTHGSALQMDLGTRTRNRRSKLSHSEVMAILVLQDRVILRKRALIETVNDELKNQCQVEHTRHRSFENFITNCYQGW